MKIRVNPHNVEIVKEQTEPINEREIKVSKCEFEFDEVITSDFVKEAYFTLNGNTYKQIIVNNECDYPSEVLTEKGTLEIGVVAYKVENEQEIKRYNPSPDYFESWVGSLKDAENSEPITPSEMEQFEQELQNGLNDIQDAIENAERLDIDANKVGKITSITITKQDGTTKTVTLEDGQDGISLEDIEIDNRDLYVTYGGETENLGQIVPNIQVGTTTTGLPNTSASVVNVGTDLNPILNFTIPKGEAGAIKMLIVAVLPTTGEDDTIYLVPLENPTEEGNNYAEYVYINNQWELLGKIGVQVDLTDYVKNTDYATANKGGVIKGNVSGFLVSANGTPSGDTRTFENYSSAGNALFISKGTLENVITGKGLVSNTDYASGSVGGIIKVNGADYGSYMTSGGVLCASMTSYANYGNKSNNYIISKGTLENVLNEKIGDIQTLLDNLDVGNGVS